jgi:hypothetical protein
MLMRILRWVSWIALAVYTVVTAINIYNTTCLPYTTPPISVQQIAKVPLGPALEQLETYIRASSTPNVADQLGAEFNRGGYFFGDALYDTIYIPEIYGGVTIRGATARHSLGLDGFFLMQNNDTLVALDSVSVLVAHPWSNSKNFTLYMVGTILIGAALAGVSSRGIDKLPLFLLLVLTGLNPLRFFAPCIYIVAMAYLLLVLLGAKHIITRSLAIFVFLTVFLIDINLNGFARAKEITKNGFNVSHLTHDTQSLIAAIHSGTIVFSDINTCETKADIRYTGDGYYKRIYWLSNTNLVVAISSDNAVSIFWIDRQPSAGSVNPP